MVNLPLKVNRGGSKSRHLQPLNRWLHWRPPSRAVPWISEFCTRLSESRSFCSIVTTINHLSLNGTVSSIQRAILHGLFESFIKLWLEHIIDFWVPAISAGPSWILWSDHVHKRVFSRINDVEVGRLINLVLEQFLPALLFFFGNHISGRHVVVAYWVVVAFLRWRPHMHRSGHIVILIRLSLLVGHQRVLRYIGIISQSFSSIYTELFPLSALNILLPTISSLQ